jgi:deoxyribonuclease IV
MPPEPVQRRFGLHTSTSGGVDNAALEAIELGANCFQIFSSSPRTWRATAPDPARIKVFRALRDKHDLAPVAVHTNYLINLAASDEAVLRQSMVSFRGELERALAIGAEYLVLHPGSRKGHPNAESALTLVAASVAAAANGLQFPPAHRFRLLFENTTFEELSLLASMVRRVSGVPVGFCIDTCHCYAAGYDVSTPQGLSDTVSQMEQLLGLENIPMFHANDSKGELGSHLDRHANIGEGRIGESGFRGILQHPALVDKAFILETPSEDGASKRDLAALQRLAGGGAADKHR